MNNIIIFIKGFLFGTANVIPGVSGGTMAIILGVYEKLLDLFGYFFKNLKENIKFLIPFGLGIVFAIFIMSNVISYALSNYETITTFFFVGLILGGLPPLYKKVKNDLKTENIIYFFASFLLVVAFSFLKSGSNNIDLGNTSFIIIFIVGLLSSVAMIIPGISGSFLLVLLGFYEPIINVIKDILDFNDFVFNFFILMFFGLGIVFGIVFVSRLIKYLLSKYENKTYYVILGFVLASIITLLYNIEYSGSNLSLTFIALIIGQLISLKLGE